MLLLDPHIRHGILPIFPEYSTASASTAHVTHPEICNDLMHITSLPAHAPYASHTSTNIYKSLNRSSFISSPTLNTYTSLSQTLSSQTPAIVRIGALAPHGPKVKILECLRAQTKKRTNDHHPFLGRTAPNFLFLCPGALPISGL